MKFESTKLYSVIKNKCPRCHQGNFFVSNNPYNLRKFSEMNDKCPLCKEDFRKEPGYYFGASYVSYGITVTFGILLFLLLCVVFTMDTIPFIFSFSVLLIVLMPVLYRSSRLIWINMFVSYNKKAS